MGMNIFSRSCGTSLDNSEAIAPNPSPNRWEILFMMVYPNSYVLKVKYEDCTNFEGEKIMVYRGQYIRTPILDPHFQESGVTPIARFQPTDEGWELAKKFAGEL